MFTYVLFNMKFTFQSNFHSGNLAIGVLMTNGAVIIFDSNRLSAKLRMEVKGVMNHLTFINS